MNKFEEIYWPIRNKIRDRIFNPIWYRIFGHKFHIVKTDLPPQSWYDTDIRILYAVMECVKWFVENDMRTCSKEDFEEEIDRIKNDEATSDDWKKSEIEVWENQWNRDQEIIAIADWWKDYDRRCEEVNVALTVWADHCKICGDDWLFINNKKKMSEEEKTKERDLFKAHMELEEKLDEETQEMLHKAIELRRAMWS